MSVTLPQTSTETVRSKYKIPVVELSFDEETTGMKEAVAAHKDIKDAVSPGMNGSKKSTRSKGKSFDTMTDAYYKSNIKALNTSNKHCNNGDIGGPSKRTFIEKATPVYIVLDSSDKSTKTP